MTVLPADSHVLVPTLLPLVSHFQFPVSVRKMRKHEKLKFWFYHWTLKDDLQDQACIVNLHIDISAYFPSFLLDQRCRDTLPLPSLNNFSWFKDTPYTWSKPRLYSLSENDNFIPGLSPVLQAGWTCWCFRSVSSTCQCTTSPDTPEEQMFFPAVQPLTWGTSMKEYLHVLCNDAR